MSCSSQQESFAVTTDLRAESLFSGKLPLSFPTKLSSLCLCYKIQNGKGVCQVSLRTLLQFNCKLQQPRICSKDSVEKLRKITKELLDGKIAIDGDILNEFSWRKTGTLRRIEMVHAFVSPRHPHYFNDFVGTIPCSHSKQLSESSFMWNDKENRSIPLRNKGNVDRIILISPPRCFNQNLFFSLSEFVP